MLKLYVVTTLAQALVDINGLQLISKNRGAAGAVLMFFKYKNHLGIQGKQS